MGEASETAAPRTVALVLAVLLVAVLAAVRLVSDGEAQSPGTIPANPGPSPSGTSSATSEVVVPFEPPPQPLSARELGGIRFVEVAHRVGLAARGAAGPSPTAADVDAGAAVTDLDDDGDLDLLLTSSGRASGLYRNDGGTFTDITARSGLGRLPSVTAAAFADIDSDGDLDLFLGGPGTDFGRLLVNDGTERFTDMSQALGVVGRPENRAEARSVRGVDFGDIDRDGDLDLVVTDWNPGAVVAADVARGDGDERRGDDGENTGGGRTAEGSDAHARDRGRDRAAGRAEPTEVGAAVQTGQRASSTITS